MSTTQTAPEVDYDHRVEGQHEHNGVRLLPSTPADHLRRIQQLQTTRQDCLVATFSKSGTTWLQEILYLVCNGADGDEAASRPLVQRIPFLDYVKMWPLIEQNKGPKILKTHLGPSFYEEKLKSDKLKAIVMMRNPKDTLSSFYHFYRSNRAMGGFDGTWDQFFHLVKNNRLIYGDWFDYTLGWWDLKSCKNVLFLKYEDMLKNAEKGIRQVAKFVEKDLSDDQINRIVSLTSFANMKKNKSVNYAGADFLDASRPAFMRKGVTGDWKNHFTVEQSEYFDKWYAERMKGSSLHFDFQ